MIVGTGSHSGKSVVAAGLCRLLARTGHKVAPFKAQNMSLNSFVTSDGGEMGRAQVVQAVAAGIEPHTDMNPVLLKPLGEAGSQVILNGHAIGNFKPGDYYAGIERMRTVAHEAYDRLSSRFDVIVMEGAGSPVEINLMERDIANMAMAKYAHAKVLLVADIDRGGVFASIYGTVELLPPEYGQLLAGVIINKFRGDKSLLDPGLREIERLTRVPVLGVLPFIGNLGIDEEDSVALDDRAKADAFQIDGAERAIDILVVRLPHISNYTDFQGLEKTGGIRVRYVETPGQAGKPDLIVLPGTKNTIEDLRDIRGAGWQDYILKAATEGTPVFGICGGYQMLGERICDPLGVEGKRTEEKGIGLLPITTTLNSAKELSQVSGYTTNAVPFAKPGTSFTGYEIHAGHSTITDVCDPALVAIRRQDSSISEPCGVISRDRHVFGTYIHGLFDEPAMRNQLVEWLCRRKAIDPTEIVSRSASSLDSELNRLADIIEQNMDIKRIKELIRVGS